MNDPNLSYRSSSSRADTGIGRVILLYEQLVQDLRRALTAIDAHHIEARTLELGHALEVVGQLQGRLDMDAGREVAHNLDRFYTGLQQGILAAQVQSSKPLLLRLIDNVLAVREAWLEVERKMQNSASVSPQAPSSARKSHQDVAVPSGRNWQV